MTITRLEFVDFIEEFNNKKYFIGSDLLSTLNAVIEHPGYYCKENGYIFFIEAELELLSFLIFKIDAYNLVDPLVKTIILWV